MTVVQAQSRTLPVIHKLVLFFKKDRSHSAPPRTPGVGSAVGSLRSAWPVGRQRLPALAPVGCGTARLGPGRLHPAAGLQPCQWLKGKARQAEPGSTKGSTLCFTSCQQVPHSRKPSLSNLLNLPNFFPKPLTKSFRKTANLPTPYIPAHTLGSQEAELFRASELDHQTKTPFYKLPPPSACPQAKPDKPPSPDIFPTPGASAVLRWALCPGGPQHPPRTAASSRPPPVP